MKLALWIMNRFAVNPSLSGDIAEEWASGQPTWWLLRQTLVAIASAISSGLWNHKLRTIVAVVTGWFDWDVLYFALSFVFRPFPHFPLGLLLFILRPILLGWIVAKLQPTQPLGTVLLYIATFFAVNLSRGHLRPQDFVIVVLFGSLLTVTTIVGGLLATGKAKGVPIPG
jgi:hypothetical protein